MIMQEDIKDPVVVCVTIYHTQTKEIDTRGFMPVRLSKSRVYTRVSREPDCKVTAVVNGKKVRVDAWRGRGGSKFVRLADAPGVLAVKLEARVKSIERQLASYRQALEVPARLIPLHLSEVKPDDDAA
jgi:hypothetical protein